MPLAPRNKQRPKREEDDKPEITHRIQPGCGKSSIPLPPQENAKPIEPVFPTLKKDMIAD